MFLSLETILFFFITAVNLSFAIDNNQCKEDQQFYDCMPSCTNTCKNYGIRDRIVCPKICRPGCYCKVGLVRQEEDGRCVSYDECPANICPENEEPSSCVSRCETCNNPGTDCEMFACNPGCKCKQGFLRNSEGKCVPPFLCPAECNSNEEFKPCGTACPKTCKNMEENRTCTEQCVEGCFCKEGYVRSENNECVRPETCPQTEKCPQNEKLTECVSPCNACKYLQGCPIKVICKPGCDCIEGYYRNDQGECIPKHKCTGICPIREEPTECVSRCESCANPGIDCELFACIPGCKCKQGLLRNSEGICIPEYACPAKCKNNEEYKTCGTSCPATCENMNEKRICTLQCVEGCFCKEGYVRSKTNQCIRSETCPQINNCGPLQKFYECKPSCRTTCATYNKRMFCPQRNCSPGCECIEGLVKDQYGDCINPKNCNKICSYQRACYCPKLPYYDYYQGSPFYYYPMNYIW